MIILCFNFPLHAFFYKQRFFSIQPQCCLTFYWTDPQMLLANVLPRHALCFVLSLCLGLFMSYICNLFFHYHFHFNYNFITINYIISLRQKNLLFGHVCQMFSLRVLPSFCLIFWGSKACKTPLNFLTVKLLCHIQILWKH